MKHFYLLFLSVCISFSAFSQTQPKNIIIVLANGVGHNHLAAYELYTGSEPFASLFPNHYAVTTHPAYSNTITEPKEVQYFTGDYHTRRVWSEFEYANGMVTCAASAGTAIATGIKSAYKAVGVDLDSTELETILERAFALGKSTGIITDMPFANSAVASFAAHNPSSDNTTEIFAQLLGSNLQLMIGAGNPYYSNNGELRSTPEYTYILEEDWNSLLQGHLNFSHGISVTDITGNGSQDYWSLLQSFDDLDSVATRKIIIPHMFDAIQFKRTDLGILTTVPTMDFLTMYGLQHLGQNPEGFAAVIETGAVDYASQQNNAETMLRGMQDLITILASVNVWIENNSSWDETLVIVTSTYETGFLTGTDFDPASNDYTQTIHITEGQAGSIPEMTFQSTLPSKLATPLFAKGPGSEFFADYADQEDFVYGHVISNSEIGQVCKRLWPLTPLAKPKNIILMINDGAALNSIRAAEYYTGNRQQYRDFPVSLYMSTYQLSTTARVDGVHSWNNSYESRLAWTDSAYLLNRTNATCSGASATAIATGQKTYYYSMGVDKDGNALNTIARHAKLLQKSSGFAVNKAVYDATPAAFFTNNVSRDNYDEITRQLIIESKADVAIGTNHPGFRDDGSARETLSTSNMGGDDFWEDIVAQRTVFRTASNSGWTQVQDVTGDGNPNAWTLIEDSVQFANLLTGDTPDRILGIAKVGFSTQLRRNQETVQEVSFEDWNPEMPCLWMKAGVALNHVSKNPNGFFLMIEGSALDNAAHSNWKGRLIEEQMVFDRAVDSVIAWIERNGGWDENLLIVTSDHETGMLLGPNFKDNYRVIDHFDIIDNGVGEMPGMEFTDIHHSNMLVPFFAKGAGSELFIAYADEQDYVQGKYLTNSEIGQVMFYVWDGRPGTIINHKPLLVSRNPIPDVFIPVGKQTVFSIDKNFVIDEEDTEFLYSVRTKPRWVEVIDDQNLEFSATPPSVGRFNTIFDITDGKTSGAGLTIRGAFIIEVVESVSVSEISEKTAFAYPNPTITNLVVSVPSGSAHIILYNQTGARILQEFVNYSETDIELGNLAPGVYVLDIHEKDKTTRQTIIIQ